MNSYTHKHTHTHTNTQTDVCTKVISRNQVHCGQHMPGLKMKNAYHTNSVVDDTVGVLITFIIG